jgi:predicted MFS family arabinose efflux permease
MSRRDFTRSIPQPGHDRKALPRHGRWTLLLAVSAAYFLSLADRQLLAILQEPIKNDLRLLDTHLGFLSLLFALAYAFASFPLAHLVDRGRVSGTVIGTLGVWSAFTMLCGVATSFAVLAIGRAGVALGEAGCAPAGHALISARFPVHERARALSILSEAAVLGSAAAYGGGGILEQRYGWRTTFLILGAAGIAIIPILHFILRGESRTAPAASSHGFGLFRVAGEFWRLLSLRYLTLTMILSAIGGYGMTQWIGSFLVRVHDLPVADAGWRMLVGTAVSGIIGVLLAGFMSDRAGARDARAYAAVPAVLMALSVPMALLLSYSSTATIATITYSWCAAATVACAPPIFAVVQRLAPPTARGMAAALIIFMTNVAGLGVGPVLLGMISDLLTSAGYSESLRQTFITSAILFAASALMAVRAAFALPGDIAAASRHEAIEESFAPEEGVRRQ